MLVIRWIWKWPANSLGPFIHLSFGPADFFDDMVLEVATLML
jgi:hypothetical protein